VSVTASVAAAGVRAAEVLVLRQSVAQGAVVVWVALALAPPVFLAPARSWRICRSWAGKTVKR
jgi:hypothetical protein